MAMTKKEKLEFERLKTMLSLRFTQPVKPDLLPPETYDRIINGYLYNVNSLRIDPACTSSMYYSSYQHNKTTSQGSKSLYSTKILALKAMRNEVEIECALKLRRIDLMIEHEIHNT